MNLKEKVTPTGYEGNPVSSKVAKLSFTGYTHLKQTLRQLAQVAAIQKDEQKSKEVRTKVPVLKSYIPPIQCQTA